MRLDLYLVERGLAPSRSKAQELIRNGVVEVDGVIQTQTSKDVSAENSIRVHPNSILKYVSRGGLKLEDALLTTKLDVVGFRVLDVGQSTGGFTDCVLKMGAREVLGVDVGHGQIHGDLRGDSRVTVLEGVHVNQMSTHPQIVDFLRSPVDLVVVDVSFVSLEGVLKILWSIPGTFQLLALIKPQFEVGPSGLNKKGVVKDTALIAPVLKRMDAFASGLGFKVQAIFPSAVEGGDGNQEYFLHALKVGP